MKIIRKNLDNLLPFRVYVKDEKSWAKAQENLYKMVYRWFSTKITHARFGPFYYVNKFKHITFSHIEDSESFYSHEFKEINEDLIL